MNDLDNFLVDLNNTELAIFIAYRFDEFLETSQKKIIAEAQKRQLSQEQLSQLFRKGLPLPLDNIYSCPQCHSIIYQVETDYVLKHTSYGGYETAVETNRCRLCGFNPAKNEPKGFLNKIKMLLGLYKRRRLKRPEIDGQMFT